MVQGQTNAVLAATQHMSEQTRKFSGEYESQVNKLQMKVAQYSAAVDSQTKTVSEAAVSTAGEISKMSSDMESNNADTLDLINSANDLVDTDEERIKKKQKEQIAADAFQLENNIDRMIQKTDEETAETNDKLSEFQDETTEQNEEAEEEIEERKEERQEMNDEALETLSEAKQMNREIDKANKAANSANKQAFVTLGQMTEKAGQEIRGNAATLTDEVMSGFEELKRDGEDNLKEMQRETELGVNELKSENNEEAKALQGELTATKKEANDALDEEKGTKEEEISEAAGVKKEANDALEE